jgi:RNA polymerase sigma-70 factor (ECF subfamily)
MMSAPSPTATLGELIQRPATSDELRRFIRGELRGPGPGRVSAHELVEDILQETWVRALSRASTYDPDRGAMAWLVAIARNALREHWRRSRVRRERGGDPAAFEGRPAEGPADRGEEIDAMAAAIRRLGPKDRRAVELRFLEGLTGPELASALGVPTPGAARAETHRAMVRLRALMGAAPSGPEGGRRGRRATGGAVPGVGRNVLA